MKTKNQVISENPRLKDLINAVIHKIGIDAVQDVNNHGIDGGFNGFIYYHETVAFFNRHRKAILELAQNFADDFGIDLLSMIASFNCLSTNQKPNFSQNEIAKAIYSGKGESVDIIKNAMAWFAAEEICRLFDN